MLLQIKHENGLIETIAIMGPVVIAEGGRLNKIQTANGMDYFFTKDGYYDGWGKSFMGSGLTKKEVDDNIGEIERHRFIHMDRGSSAAK